MAHTNHEAKPVQIDSYSCFSRLFKDSDEIIIILDQNSNIVYANPAACKTLKYSSDNIKSLKLETIFEKKDAELLNKLSRGKSPLYSFPETVDISKKDEKKIKFKVHLSRLNIVEKSYLLISCRVKKQLKIVPPETEDILKDKLIKISSNLINVEIDEIEQELTNMLKEISSVTDFDRSVIFMISKNNEKSNVLCLWQKEEFSEIPESTELTPWLFQQMQISDHIVIENVNDLPIEAYKEKELWSNRSIKSLIIFPIFSRGSLTGYLQFDSVKKSDIPKKEIVHLLRDLANITANALDRKVVEETMEYRADMERILSMTSAQLINVPEEEFDGAMIKDLNFLSNFTKADAADIFILKDPETFYPAYSWNNKTVEQKYTEKSQFNIADYPILFEKLNKSVTLRATNIEESHKNLQKEITPLIERDISAFLAIPMKPENEIIGFLTFKYKQAKVKWDEEEVILLRIASDIFSNALKNKRVRESLKQSKAEYKKLFDSLINGYIFFGIKRNKKGKAREFIYEDVNPSYEKITGISRKKVIGKKLGEVAPSLEELWLEKLKTVTSQKRKVEFQQHIFELNRDFKVCVTLVNPQKISLIFEDITQFKKIENILEYRINFEKLIAQISTDFIKAELNQIDKQINKSLEKIAEFAEADRSYVFLFSDDMNFMSNVYEWYRKGVQPFKEKLQNIPASDLPWFTENIQKKPVVLVEDVDDLPPEAENEKKEWQSENIKTIICMPLKSGGKIIGFIGFDFVEEKTVLSPIIADILRITGDMFANAIIRRQKDRNLNYRELFEKTIANISTEFINLKTDQINSGIDKALNVVSRFCKADRGFITLLDESKNELNCTHEWVRDKTFSKIEESAKLDLEKFKKLFKELDKSGYLKFNSIKDVSKYLPPEEKKIWNGKINPAYLLPIILRGKILGFSCYSFINNQPEREEDTLVLLRIINEIFANALDKQKTENELIKSEKRYRTLIENIDLGVCLLDKELNILTVNEPLSKILNKSKNELIGKKCHQELWPEEPGKVPSPGRKTRDTGKSQLVEKIVQNRKGENLTLRIKTFPLTDENEQITAIIEVTEDVTEQKKTLEELRRTKFSVENSIDPILWFNEKGQVTDANKAAFKTFGYKEKELLSMNIHDLDLQYDEKAWAEHWKKIKKEKSLVFEADPQTKEGKKLTVEVASNYIEFEGKQFNCAVIRDITERKKAEEKIHESQRMMKVILDTIPSAVFWKDEDSVYLGANKTFIEFTGLENESDIVGKTDKQIWKKYADIYTGYDQKILSKGKPVLQYEQPVYNYKKDEERWVKANKVPLRDLEGNIMGVLGSFEDITKQKQTMKQLTLTRHAMENSIFSVLWLNEKGEIIYANTTACKRLGYTKEELMNMKDHDIDVDMTPQIYEKMWNEIKQKKELIMEREAVKKDGTKIPIEVAANYIKYEDSEIVFVSSRNISERKKAEEKILESQKMLRLVLDTIPARVFWKDTNSKYLGCNVRFAKDAGYEDPQQLIGKDDYDMPWKPEAQDYRADDAKVMRSGKEKLNFQEPQTTPSGEKLVLRTSKVPLRDIKGNIIGMLGTYEDITDLVKTQKELRLTQFAVENSFEEVFYINKDGSLNYVNQAACDILNYSKNELMQKKIFDIDTNLSKTKWGQHWKDLKRRESILTESQQKTKQGRLVPIELAANYVAYEDEEYECVFARDITQRKKVEFSLRMREQCFRAIADFTYDWEIWVSPTGRPLWTNESVERITGYTKEECMQMTEFPSPLVYHPDKKKVMRAFQEALKGKPGENLQFRVKRKDGKIIWCEVNWQPIYDEKGISQGHRASIREITRFKEIEQKYHKLKEDKNTEQ